jgi:PTS system ascorbate-specific IIA component
MLLGEIVEKNYFSFVDEVANWEDSIRASCQQLVKLGLAGEGYAQEIIECVRTNGPYIVLLPGIALPHSMECSPNAFGTAIAFTKIKKPVSFDDHDPEKSATVFFTLVATDNEQHLKNMRKLFTLLTNDELCADLQKVNSVEDLLALDKKYPE